MEKCVLLRKFYQSTSVFFPYRKMPSSYKGIHGKVVYAVEAKLDRSMRMDQKDKAEFNFLSRVDMYDPENMVCL